ncbi:MAG: hypothetical protein AB7T48_00325 [Solirubrobacterales bacterium]
MRPRTRNLGTSTPTVVTPDLVRRRAIAVVVHDEYMGEVRAKVKRLKPLV